MTKFKLPVDNTDIIAFKTNKIWSMYIKFFAFKRFLKVFSEALKFTNLVYVF